MKYKDKNYVYSSEYWHETYIKRKEKHNQYVTNHYNTKKGKSQQLAANYKYNDKKSKRGESTLTPEWIEENILNSKCIYCGEDDWKKMSADRIDNDLPHTPDNVVPSCWECNNKRRRKDFFDFYFDNFVKKMENLKDSLKFVKEKFGF